jgi:hypothetical protein
MRLLEAANGLGHRRCRAQASDRSVAQCGFQLPQRMSHEQDNPDYGYLLRPWARDGRRCLS